MLEQNQSLELLVEKCLESLGIVLLCDWDILVFLYRHQVSLVSAEQMARLLGYPSKAVADALDTLELLKLVTRSRASQGVRLYQFLYADIHLSFESCFQRLMAVGDTRAGRLLLTARLRQPR